MSSQLQLWLGSQNSFETAAAAALKAEGHIKVEDQLKAGQAEELQKMIYSQMVSVQLSLIHISEPTRPY